MKKLSVLFFVATISVSAFLLSSCAFDKKEVPSGIQWIEVDGISEGEIEFDYDTGCIVDAVEDICIANIPDSIDGIAVTKIGVGAFKNCQNLGSVIIPDTITSIGNNAFTDCTYLTAVVIPNSVTTIEAAAFYGCKHLESVIIPNSLSIIDEGIFDCCISLSAVTIPDSVKTIEEGAFKECSSLQSITIPSSVTYINEYAFHKCDNLTTIYFNGTESQWKSIDMDIPFAQLQNIQICYVN